MVSLLLVLNILSPIVTHAAEERVYPEVWVNETSNNEYYHYLQSFKLSDSEILELYQRDANRFETKILLPEELANKIGQTIVTPQFQWRFPSHPRVGDKYRDEYNINFKEALERAGIYVGATADFSGLVATISPDVAIRAIAASILAGAIAFKYAQQIYYKYKSSGFKYTGVRGVIVWEYRINNDWALDWQVNPSECVENYY